MYITIIYAYKTITNSTKPGIIKNTRYGKERCWKDTKDRR